MNEETRAGRRMEIEEAAFALLAEKGFAATSMLAVAQRAKASNETLYRWYGDKIGLFRALVERNALSIRARLADALASGQPPRAVLEKIGPALLAMLVSDRAIALNRAAAADPTDTLGQALAEAGRESVLPLVVRIFERAHAERALRTNDPGATAARYLNLLVGDLQIRRATGALPPPPEAEIADRAARALADIVRLHTPREQN